MREPAIFVSVGVSGSGKTHGVKKQVFRAVAEGMSVVVIDRTREWTSVPASLSGVTALVSSVDAARARFAAGARLAIVGCTSKDLAKQVAAACAWAGEKGPGDTRREGLPRGVAIPEAHRVLPNVGGLVGGAEAIDDCVTAFRHANALLWLDTQRFAKLNRTAVEQAETIRVYACGPRDVGAVAEDFATREHAPELEAAIRKCGARKKAKQPGWYIELEQTAVLPPFELQREPA
jgi:hypothetical protein